MPQTDRVDSHTAGSPTLGLLRTTRWRMVMLLFVLYTINCIDRMSLSVALPSIVRDFHMSATLQGLVLSAFFWTYSTFQIPGGWAADRWGARRVIGIAATLWGAFQCACAFVSNGVSLLLCRIGLGVFEAPYMPAASKLTASWLPPTERARGVTLIDSGAPLGSALGGLAISALIGATGSWRTAFIVVGALTIAFGLLTYLLLRDKPEQHPRIDAAERDYIAARKAAAGERAGEVRVPLPTRIVAAMVVGRIGWAMVFFGLVTWGPNYLSAGRGLDIRSMGFATFLIFLAGAIGEMSSGYIADRMQRRFGASRAFKVLFAISGGASLVCLLCLPAIADVRIAVAVLSIGVFFHLWGGLYWLIPAMLAPQEQVGRVGGIMNFAGTGAGIVVPIAVGLIVDASGGFNAVILFFAACAAAYLIGSLFIDFGYGAARERRAAPGAAE
ncbi:MFS transporter [Chitinasiproducens palmae]|uniref:MFS transporter, ACS family, D-galactonate transporter n=1 Tax=Chitinasiproducens palmae TaxID=1770053 RepID=A0A1H2PJU8_9BURK|nr:MFS transporter [Chitinasiproducens palmae]SDV46683.1 MFS transporter, ACS family, D-galactonate transporter [Chitinasiproducens palmae]